MSSDQPSIQNLSAELEQISINNEYCSAEEDKALDLESAIEDASKDKPEVMQRVKALKKVHLEMQKVEASFIKEVHALECKYLPKYGPFFEQRRKIILGEYKPSIEECDFAGGSDSEEDTDEGIKREPMELKVATTEPVIGIPDFWLSIFRNTNILQELMEVYDEPILKHLTDITVEMTDDPMGFTLLFHFSPNEHFTNCVLTKTYEMNSDVTDNGILLFDGPGITKCKGCHIDWLEGKDVTVMKIEKTEKYRQNNKIRIISITVNAPSFFNFFASPEYNSELPQDKATQMQLTKDFEIGQYIRERIIPRAVLFYTGEALEDGDDVEEEEAEEEMEDEDEEGKDLQLNSQPQVTLNVVSEKSFF